MQEIEVISMDDGEDNVTATALASPPSARSLWTGEPSAPTAPTTPPPPEPVLCGAHHRADAEAAEETLFAMLANERPPLPPFAGAAARQSRTRPTPISVSGRASLPACGAAVPDEDWVNDHDRTKMCDWYYEMSDFLKIDRTTAGRSLALLDRFMAVPPDRPRGRRGASGRSVGGVVAAAARSRDEYQLAALTALFLAIKLYERLHVQPEHVSYLSRGRYASEEVVAMEAVMLAALEWRACAADRADFVDAFLDVLLPLRRGPASSGGDDDDDIGDPLRASLADLAGLQVQLADFESRYARLRPSTVALAAVVNAFEMKRESIPPLDQSLFLEGVRGVVRRMHGGAEEGRDPRAEREALARTADRLRALVDPPSGGPGGAAAPSPRPTSPLDAALESMEGFDVARLLCCSGPAPAAADGGRREGGEASAEGPADAAAVRGPIESVTSFGSADNKGWGGRPHAATTSHSPTSIATILFGTGGA